MMKLSLSCKESCPHSLSKNSCHRSLSGGCHPTWWKLPSKNWLQSPPKTSSRLFAWKHSQKFDPKPQHTSNPLQAPPARIFSSSSPPAGLQVAKGGGTSILVPFNHLPTSCTAFYQLAPLPFHSFYSSEWALESSLYSLSRSPVCPGSLSAHLSLSL